MEESPWKAVVPLRFDNSFLPDAMGCLNDLPISPEALISQGQLQQVFITPTKTTEDNECHSCRRRNLIGILGQVSTSGPIISGPEARVPG